MARRKLFCEISPLTNWISVKKERFLRRVTDALSGTKFSRGKSDALPVTIYKHSSLIRRKLGNVDMELQENKAVNLSLAAPIIDGIIIRPGETFSFWRLVGECTAKKGYRDGLTISVGKLGRGVGGGMCQFTNLLHWMVLHSPLDITELRHHNALDLFPDYGRQVPYGCGTSIFYNYVDYRFKNNTDITFQIKTRTSGTHLIGEIRAEKPLDFAYHIEEEEKRFVFLDGEYYRRNKIYRRVVDKRTGLTVERKLIVESNAKVCYDAAFIPSELIDEGHSVFRY